MILAFLFSIQTFLKQCKALRTEKYKRYINIFIILLLLLREPIKTRENCYPLIWSKGDFCLIGQSIH